MVSEKKSARKMTDGSKTRLLEEIRYSENKLEEVHNAQAIMRTTRCSDKILKPRMQKFCRSLRRVISGSSFAESHENVFCVAVEDCLLRNAQESKAAKKMGEENK